MSTFFELIIDSAVSVTIFLALAGAIGGLLTYIFRRTIREHDAMTTEVREIKAEHIRLAAETARNTDYWEVSRQVQMESLKAVIGQVEVVSARQQFFEGNMADTRQRQSEAERSQDSLRQRLDKTNNSLNDVKRVQDDFKGKLDETNNSLNDVKRVQDDMGRAHDDFKGKLDETNNSLNDVKRTQDDFNGKLDNTISDLNGVKLAQDDVKRVHDGLKGNIDIAINNLNGVKRAQDDMERVHDDLKGNLDHTKHGLEEMHLVIKADQRSLEAIQQQSVGMREDLGILRTELQRLIDRLESMD